MWLKNITKDIGNVEVFEIFDTNTSKETYDWQTGANDIKKYINKLQIMEKAIEKRMLYLKFDELKK